jgi:hypothetical protein
VKIAGFSPEIFSFASLPMICDAVNDLLVSVHQRRTRHLSFPLKEKKRENGSIEFLSAGKNK